MNDNNGIGIYYMHEHNGLQFYFKYPKKSSYYFKIINYRLIFTYYILDTGNNLCILNHSDLITSFNLALFSYKLFILQI